MEFISDERYIPFVLINLESLIFKEYYENSKVYLISNLRQLNKRKKTIETKLFYSLKIFYLNSHLPKKNHKNYKNHKKIIITLPTI